jgi:hypothetical protein
VFMRHLVPVILCEWLSGMQGGVNYINININILRKIVHKVGFIYNIKACFIPLDIVSLQLFRSAKYKCSNFSSRCRGNVRRTSHEVPVNSVGL